MESVQCQIRQPASLPVSIAVPTYPRLAALEAQLQKLNEEALAAAGEVAGFQREKASLEYQSQSVAATSDIFSRLAEVQRQLARLEARHAQAQAQAKRVSEELGSLRHEFGFRFYRRQMLSRELAEASAGPPQMRAYALGEKPRRPRLQVLTELDECVGWLAVWSDDPNLAKEVSTIQQQLLEARQQQ